MSDYSDANDWPATMRTINARRRALRQACSERYDVPPQAVTEEMLHTEEARLIAIAEREEMRELARLLGWGGWRA